MYLGNYINLTVVNDAIAGRSARSYTREGRFTTLTASVQSGDYVIIEFGHNDGGSLTPTDNGRTDCGVVNNNYATTCKTTYEYVCCQLVGPSMWLICVYSGVAETVLTYEAYYANAAKALIAKGAKVILSSPTPDNPWESGTFVYSASRFTGYGRDAATATGAVFVDHGLYTADNFKNAGS
jgi:rhamnogalacturonan acetylesterase